MRRKYILWLIALSLSASSLFAQKTTKVTAIQYYYNTDPGVGLPGNGAILSVTDTSNFNQVLNFSLPTLPLGFNQLYVRAKDEFDRWGIAERRTFFVAPLNINGNIIAYEYFFDSDYGIGNNSAGGGAIVNIAPTSNFNQPIHVPLPSPISNGFHTLFIRTKNSLDRWSIAERRNFYVNSNNNTQTITALEYYFDTDPGVGNGINYPVASAANINTTANFNVPCLTNGTHYLYLRAKDEFNRWSIIDRDTLTVTAGINPFVVSPAGPISVCASDSVTLTTTITQGISYQWKLNGNPISGATGTSFVVHTTGVYSVGTSCGASSASSNNVTINVQPLNTYYRDFDGDGFGDVNSDSIACAAPAGYVSNSTDCDDNNIGINTPFQYYVDADHDNYGSTTTAMLCVLTPPLGYSTNNTDCDDNVAGIYAPIQYYVDADHDNYGSTSTAMLCVLTPPIGYSTNNTDCDDAVAGIHAPIQYYVDADHDGYGSTTTAMACALTPPLGYSTNNTDCNDSDANVHVAIQYYVDNDHDGFGSATTAMLCSAPAPFGYATTNNDCNDADALQKPGQVWYIDADGDDYGRNGAPITQCSRPLNGYVAAELTATTGDCDDNNASINPANRYFTFTGNQNYTNSLVYPLTGSSYTTFHFEATYFDPTNALPALNYPRLLLDFEGNGIYTDANDRLYLMTQDDVSDVTTNNGKRYSINVNGLPTGTAWTAKIIANDVGGCTTAFGPFNAMDIFEEPNLVIFANDLNFSPIHPNPGDNVVVSATIHNASDYPAQNFYVHLTNQYDSITYTYNDIVVSNLPARTNTTVTWVIQSPPVPAWVPMEVRIDQTNVITETNELDNRAVRPFVNGNFNLPGGIVCTAAVTPFQSNSSASNYPVLSGNVHYYGLAVPLQDSSVAGATVTFTIVETGSVFTGYTGSNGYYSCSFPGPIDTGLYHINVSVTDYTLTGSANTTFRILPCVNLPDLTASLNLSYTNGVPGNSFSGTITITNSGCANVGATVCSVTQSGGTPAVGNINVGALTAGQSQTFQFGPIVVANPGSFTMCANADATGLIVESNEQNNSTCPTRYAFPTGGGSNGGGGGYGNLGSSNFSAPSSLACNANYFSILVSNSTNIAVGSFTVQTQISKNGVPQTTLTQTVPSLAALSSVYVTYSYNYGANGPGVYTYTVNTDAVNSITETDENDNVSFYTNTLLACKPNLKFVECDSITTSPANVQPGGTVNLTGNIINSGQGVAVGPVTVNFNYSTGGSYNAVYNGNIPVGSGVPVTVAAPVPIPGTNVTASIDPLNQIAEESESDNMSAGNLCYDFRIDTLCGSGSNVWDDHYNLFEELNVRAGLSNLGLLMANNVEVRFQLSGPTIAGTITLGTATVPAIGKTCKCPTQAYINNGFVFTQNGLYTLTITADPNNNFTECNESNNVKVIHIQVSDLPEMRLLSQYINPSLLNPDVGQPVTFDVTYENTGRENLNDSIRMNFLIDNVQLATVYPLPGLPKNAHATVPIPLSWSSNIPGIHIMRGVIDADSVVDESNEFNNEGTRAIVVGQSANLFFQAFTPSNLTPALYSTLTINTTIGNSGDLPCEADVQYYYKNGNSLIPIGAPVHVDVPANSNVVLNPYNWTVTNNSTLLVGKIINSLSLEYTYDDNETSVKLGGFSLSFTTTPESCPSAANGTATATVSGGAAPYSYLWSNAGGSVGSGTILTATGGTYTVTVTDNAAQTATGTVTINTTPDITIPVFANCPVNITQCHTSVTWTPPTATDNCGTATITSDYNPGDVFAQGTTTVTYSANDGNGNIATCSFNVTITAPPIWYLDYDGDGYSSGTTVASCTSPGTGYTLTVFGNGDCNDTSATVYPGAPEICFNAIDENCNGQIDENCCVSSIAATSITSNAGNNEICIGADVTLTLNGGTLGSNAIWKWYKNTCGGLANAFGTGTNITVTPASTTTYFVRAEGCDTSACVQITIVVKSAPPSASVIVPPINNLPAYACSGTNVSNINVPSVTGATSYIWDAPAGTTFNNGMDIYASPTPGANILFGLPSTGASGYYIGVQAANACGNTLRKVQWVRNSVSVPVAIIAVNGRTTECANTTASYSIAAVVGATSYLWTITGNATVTSSGTTATVTFGSTWTGGTLSVAAQTPCYTSPSKSLTLTNTSPAIGVMSGTFSVCAGITYTYSVPSVPGVSSYSWSLPLNASGFSTSNNINVTFNAGFTSGNISVTATSICGAVTAARVKTIVVGTPPIPTSINGASNGLCNSLVSYSCPPQSGVTFTWSSSSGTISNGQGTNSSSINFGAFTYGTVSVVASNICGASIPRTISVKGAPNTPGIITANPTAWCNNDAGIQFTSNLSGLSGAYNLNWAILPGTAAIYVSGQGTSAYTVDWNTGNATVSLTASNACGTATRTSATTSSCREFENADAYTTESLKVFPNPATDKLTIEFVTEKAAFVKYQFSDVAGKVIMLETMNVQGGLNRKQIDLSKISKGVYTLNVTFNEESENVKVVIQ